MLLLESGNIVSNVIIPPTLEILENYHQLKSNITYETNRYNTNE